MRPSWMPSIGDILFILILQLLIVCLPNFIFGDGSTGWHLLTGHFILDHQQIPRTDLVSYTFPDKAWVAYEWLFDLVIAALDKVGGLRLVAVACCSAIAYLFLLIYNDCRRRGCHFMFALTLCTIGALVSAIHWLARPHLITFFGVFIYTRFLRDFSENSITAKKLLIILGSTMLIWVNSHPAFLMGLVIIGIYLTADLCSFLYLAPSETKSLCLRRAKVYAMALLIVLAVTFINPYGLNLYSYIVEYLHQSVVLAENDEFGSPVFHGQLQSVLLEFLYFLIAVGLAISKKRAGLGTFLTVLAYTHLSLSARRNMPLFVIVSTPFIATLFSQIKFNEIMSLSLPWKTAKVKEPDPASDNKVNVGQPASKTEAAQKPEQAETTQKETAAEENRPADPSNALNPTTAQEQKTPDQSSEFLPPSNSDLRPASWLQPLIKLWNSTGETIDAMEFQCTRHALPALAVIVLAISCFNNGKSLGVEIVTSKFDPRTKPSGTLDYIKANNLDQKRGFNYDNWGGYIAYKTGARVFIDDRSDFYGEKFYLDYRDAATAQPNWQKVLDKYKIDWILFPKNSVLGPHIKRDANWKLVATDEGAELFERVNLNTTN